MTVAAETRDRLDTDEIERWLVAQGLDTEDLSSVLAGLCARLNAAGVAVARAHISLPTLHPSFEAQGCTWLAGAGTTLGSFEHGNSGRAPYQTSPIKHAVDGLHEFSRWRLDGPDIDPRFPILAEFRAEGLTDYAILLVRFGDEQRPIALRGVATTWATGRAGGFRDGEIAALRRLNPILALVAYRVTLHYVALNLLDAYLGRDAGRRILRGQVQRGSVVRLAAVMLFADLRGFTALADRTPGETLVAWINEYLDAVVGEVESRGGEVLKFLGDGFLAIFPLAGAAAGPCGAALDAAGVALDRVAELNRRRAEAGLPAMPVDIALHLGEAMYGNIGAARRLDFTVIGPAVNECARMESLCAALGVNLALSAAFAAACGRPTRSLGVHALRGMAEPREIFTLAPR